MGVKRMAELCRLRVTASASFALLTVSFSLVAQAQTPTPTPEQLQIFNSLDPTQQQTILQNMGQRGNGAGQNGGTSGSASSSDNNSNRDARARKKIKVDDPELVTLKAEDTVIIDIDLPRPTTTLVPGANGQPAQVVTVPVTEPDVPLTELEKTKLHELIELVRSRNPYRLSRDGSIQLPGFVPMQLAGLTVEQATARVGAEPAFLQLKLKLSLLPLEKRGVEALKPFGYDLFEADPSTFTPVTDVPVPSDYVVGAGDELTVQMYGSQNRTTKLVEGRDGRINFPELGPVSVGGQRFSAVQSALEDRVSKQMIGVRASVSMGATRSIRVFVLGEANFPGSYTVSGLGTMTTALFASGGVKPIGSLRNVQLKRQGAVVRTLDLYDLLLKGDSSNDANLLPGDVIYIPTVQATVAIDGEVRRPAIYELKGSQSVAELLTLAGGLTPQADINRAELTRINASSQRVVLDINLANGASKVQALRDGDSIMVARVVPTLDSGITLSGHVYSPRAVAWHEGLRLSNVIKSVDELKPNADLHYVLIRRELPPDRRVAVLSADLSKALQDPTGSADVVLMPRDQITVFDFETDRSRIIQPILADLRLQSVASRPTETVRVDGRIKVKGEYPLEPNMHVSDLLRAGGNLQDAAYSSSAELTRYSVDNKGNRKTQTIDVDLAAIADGVVGADIALQPSDLLNIKELPSWSEREQVTLRGEVRFPGSYPIQRGETLRSVLSRAGGLTEFAFPEGSVFTREDLKVREQQQLDLLATRMQSDLATLALQSAQANQANATQSLSVGQSLLAQLKAAKAVGRLVIDLDQVIASHTGADNDIVLRDGDELVVPRQRQEVTVIGEVQTNTSHLYQRGLSRSDYIAQSGGMTRKADDNQIYVVRANGSVVANAGNRWFRSGVEMKPGDTVVVPLDTERMPALPFWQAVTQIIYNVAISAAAVNSF
jgi:protein involved in polysaccharide export with SLBB domain